MSLARHTERHTEYLDAGDPRDISRAAGILRDGGLVAFPTETVYGLGANALSVEAVEKIFVAKRRPHWDPLIVHIANRAQLPYVAAAGSRLAEDLMDAFWPGPLTLLLPKTPAIPDAVTAGRPLVGVRVPAHPVAQALLRAANVPIAAPSANTFGHISPTTAAHVLADLDGRIDAVLDGGATSVGVESTVAEVRGHEVVLYRPGGVSLAEIEAVVGSGTAWVYVAEPSTEAPTSLPSPGVGIRHYAPRARLVLVREDFARLSKPVELALVETIDRHVAHSETVGVLLPDAWNSSGAHAVFRWGPWHRPEILASRLYAGLRELDEQSCTAIVSPVPTCDGIAAAIRDRLEKAARI